MFLDPPTFVLERRINQPLPLVNLAVSTGGPFTRDAIVALGSEGSLRVDEPLRRTLGSYDLAWRADGRLVTRRGRLIARVEVTVDGWSNEATRLQLRPVARHPERWSGRRLKSYFRLAHFAIDDAACQLSEHALRPQLQPAPEFATAAR
jgi:hypothetical protein